MPLLPPSFLPLQALIGPTSGHLWTIWSHLERGLRSTAPAKAEPFAAWVADPYFGRVRLTGVLSRPQLPNARNSLLVLVHGLGGSSRSGYMHMAAQVGLEAGLTTLALNLRGADDEGSDFYHAGLCADLRAVLAHPRLTEFTEIYVLGVSLGGHVTLRAALQPLSERIRAVAALCPPLDLAASARAFDDPTLWVYRRHVLNGLKVMYQRFRDEARGSVSHSNRAQSALPIHSLPSVEQALRIASLQEWDAKIVAPRHGFGSRDEYYTTQSVGRHLTNVTLPTLIVTTRWDPMVPWATTQPFLQAAVDASASLTFGEYTLPIRSLGRQVSHAQLLTGGHVAFPASRRARPQRPRTLFHAVIDWLSRHTATGRGESVR